MHQTGKACPTMSDVLLVLQLMISFTLSRLLAEQETIVLGMLICVLKVRSCLHISDNFMNVVVVNGVKRLCCEHLFYHPLSLLF